MIETVKVNQSPTTRSKATDRVQIVWREGAAWLVQRGVRLVAWLQDNQQGLAKDISEIDLSHDDRLELRLNQGGPSVRLNPNDFDANLDRRRQISRTH